ncbi:MAG: TraR/DksA C4-type zinc finger protein [Actinomycetota bacterium]|nr:TraR/DksA C4-type zinc finger protein [Actinomycetota bacterium]
MAVDTDRYRTALEEERRRVVSAIAHLHEEHAGSLEDTSGELVSGSADNHMADGATETFDRELDYTLEENSEHVLAAIDAALERIDAGTFGVCERCGQPIAEERLEALPYATLCIDCKRAAERA